MGLAERTVVTLSAFLVSARDGVPDVASADDDRCLAMRTGGLSFLFPIRFVRRLEK